MSLLDSILGQAGQNIDIASIASKMGIDPAMAEKAVAALGTAHAEPGDTVETAAASTGLDSGMLNQIVAQIGGTGGLGQISDMLKNNPQLAGVASMLDRDGDGNPVNDILGMAKGLFGKS